MVSPVGSLTDGESLVSVGRLTEWRVAVDVPLQLCIHSFVPSFIRTYTVAGRCNFNEFKRGKQFQMGQRWERRLTPLTKSANR